MSKYIYVGLDVHKETITLAWCQAGRKAPVEEWGTISGSVLNLERVLRRLAGKAGVEFKNLKVCYEAGPCGYVIYRRLKALGVECTVVAPNKTPKKGTEKVKTDRRDARKLASNHRWGELTAITVPDEIDERIRDLVRARADAVQDSRRARQQLSGFLLRHGLHYTGRSTWTEPHMRYLRELKLSDPRQKAVLEEYLMGNQAAQERVGRLEAHMRSELENWNRKPMVDALMSLRGFQLISAMTIVAELGDPHRFPTPRSLMNFIGLVTSEATTGSNRRQGAITKIGNAHIRRTLVESAWAYRLPPKVSKELSRRQEGQPDYVRQISWKAQNRLHHKFRRMRARKKLQQKVVVAVARELAGFIWALFDAIHRHEAATLKKGAA